MYMYLIFYNSQIDLMYIRNRLGTLLIIIYFITVK